jgi:hypothetical protein
MLALSLPPMSPASWVVIGAAAASVGWLFVVALLQDRARARYLALSRALDDANGQVGGLHRLNAKLAQLCIDGLCERGDAAAPADPEPLSVIRPFRTRVS